MNNDFLCFAGSEVKALADGKIGGYLVIFTSPEAPDLARDYFTKETDFGDQETTSVYYAHGLDKTLGKRVIGKGSLKVDEVGVWITAQLDLRDDYEKAIYALAKKKKLGWSSGSAPHLVEREAVKGANFIKTWPLGLDASLTPTPCEPRTAAIPIKSLNIEEFDLKLYMNDKKDVLARAAKEIHPNGEYLDHDQDHIFVNDWEKGSHFAIPYKFREDKENSNHSVKLGESFPVRPRTEYIPINLNGSKLDTGGHPHGSVLGAKTIPSSLITMETGNEAHTGSLKAQLHTCVLGVKALLVRLNDVKDLRANRKTPISLNHLEDLKTLNTEIKNLVDEVELATEAQKTEVETKAAIIKENTEIIEKTLELADWFTEYSKK